MKYFVPALCLAFTLGIGAANAETKADTKAPKAPKEHSAKSIECSKQADAKGLHGKDRQKFRQKCKKGES